MAKQRAAVVIGVNVTGGLVPLESAAKGAEDFGRWLKGEGFKVKTITDAKKKSVTPDKIKRAVKSFVDSGRYDQLVVYFSGHGYWKNNTELWLLSGAPEDVDAAVSWREMLDCAQNCGIPHVVIISDACRTTDGDPQRQMVRGSVVFPNPAGQRNPSKIDKFMAALPGAPAYEAPISSNANKESVFTYCFRKAFQQPDPDMIRTVTEDDESFDVVPNRKLESYLTREVNGILSRINVRYEQRPFAEVPSDDDAYIARVRRPSLSESPPALYQKSSRSQKIPSVHLGHVATAAIASALNQPSPFMDSQLVDIRKLARESGFAKAEEAASKIGDVNSIVSGSGFVLHVGGIDKLIPGRGAGVRVIDAGTTRRPAIIDVQLMHLSSEVAVSFKGGCGTVLTALLGYVGHVTGADGSVANITYVPCEVPRDHRQFYRLHNRWDSYRRRHDKVDKLRAAVAAAAQFGTFRIERERAAAFADKIRIEKALDPTLGLYAAYAYAEAGLVEKIHSVRNYMRGDIGFDLFDVAMLGRTDLKSKWDRSWIGSPFPMLTQGWNFLRVRKIKLPKVLDDAQDELVPGLWTAFKPGRMQKILQAMKNGEL